MSKVGSCPICGAGIHPRDGFIYCEKGDFKISSENFTSAWDVYSEKASLAADELMKFLLAGNQVKGEENASKN